MIIIVFNNCIYVCIDLTDVPVKSEKDAITRAEMPKLNVYNKSGLSLSSSSSSEEDNVEQQMRGGEERMGDSPIKERPQPLEATGGVASSNTDAKKSALDDDVLKGMYCMDYALSLSNTTQTYMYIATLNAI